jgi:hypothetical protein
MGEYTYVPSFVSDKFDVKDPQGKRTIWGMGETQAMRTVQLLNMQLENLEEQRAKFSSIYPPATYKLTLEEDETVRIDGIRKSDGELIDTIYLNIQWTEEWDEFVELIEELHGYKLER